MKVYFTVEQQEEITQTRLVKKLHSFNVPEDWDVNDVDDECIINNWHLVEEEADDCEVLEIIDEERTDVDEDTDTIHIEVIDNVIKEQDQ